MLKVIRLKIKPSKIQLQHTSIANRSVAVKVLYVPQDPYGLKIYQLNKPCPGIGKKTNLKQFLVTKYTVECHNLSRVYVKLKRLADELFQS